MRKHLIAGGVALACASMGVLPSLAAPIHRHRVAESTVTFTLRAADPVPAGTTFWVAYGPVKGKFGLVEMHVSANHVYRAQDRLPSQGHTTFAFLAGRGRLQTRFGSAPGNPVQTIRRIGPVSLGNASVPPVVWHAPIG